MHASQMVNPAMPQLRHKCSRVMLHLCGASGHRLTAIMCVLEFAC
jgi:hypothetical protein